MLPYVLVKFECVQMADRIGSISSTSFKMSADLPTREFILWATLSDQMDRLHSMTNIMAVAIDDA